MRGLLKLRLINEMLEEFFIDDHHFIKKSLDTPNGEFYELLFDGKRTLLVRWKKRLETDVKSTNTYLLKNSIILIEKNKPLNITSQKDIISLAKDHSRELKKTLKENKVSFRKNPIRAAKILVQEMETRGW
jgi:phage-related protein